MLKFDRQQIKPFVTVNITAMPYENQGLFELTSKLPFGKYKGKSIAQVYSGDPTELTRKFIELVRKSLDLILSKYSYYDPVNPKRIDPYMFRASWDGGEMRINGRKVIELVESMHDGAKCEFEITPKIVKVKVINKTGVVSDKLSIIGCEIAKEFITRGFFKVDIFDNGYHIRPALISSPEIDQVETEICKAEGDPSYIHWCIRKVDGFCLRGSKDEIYELNDLAVFSLDSLKVKAGKITKDNSFTIKLSLKIGSKKLDQDTIDINNEKYHKYVSKSSKTATGNFDDGIFENDSYYDSDDDEDRVMRGLENGDGDLHGF